jgi:hypothetical protein
LSDNPRANPKRVRNNSHHWIQPKARRHKGTIDHKNILRVVELAVLVDHEAWSHNLGHENALTTFSSYGNVAQHRQAEMIRTLTSAGRVSPPSWSQAQIVIRESTASDSYLARSIERCIVNNPRFG